MKNEIIILSDEVYDRLYYVPFTRIATLSPEIERLTITVGSAGKNFYATGWRVGWLMGPEHLIKHVSAAHTRICYSSVSPLQEACAVGECPHCLPYLGNPPVTNLRQALNRPKPKASGMRP